ncbi:MAG: lysophospholipase [Lachnospiraceae bacterium]|nr:lysophospholipase [Lachnospiraceae bacterium]
MLTEEFQYGSRDMRHKIHARGWLPAGAPKAQLIIVHGMSEHIGRYGEMAEYLASEGIAVAGADLLGHGLTANEAGKFGFFCDNDPATIVVRDVHRLKKLMEKKYPGVPIFIFGHSMGSIIVREYLNCYGTGVSGAILMGCVDRSVAESRVSKHLLELMAVFRGWEAKSDFATKTALYRNTKGKPRFPTLSHREESVKAHAEDPFCNHEFTLNGYYTLCELMKRANNKKHLSRVPKDLPILLLCGKEDQFGDYGAAPERIRARYEKAGVKNVTVRLFDKDAHEVYQEEDRFDAFVNIADFITGGKRRNV